VNASDVMTKDVVSVRPDTTVPDLVHLLLSRNISGTPVVDADGVLVGVVTEGDLLRRAELGTERKRGGWLAFFTGTSTLAQDFVRSHATKVSDIMSPGVVAVTPETSLAEIADTMEQKHVRRVPVVRDGRVVGIVSRSNLLRAFASRPVEAAPASSGDAEIRSALLAELSKQSWSRRPENSVVVTEGVVHLWGLAATDEEKRALELVAEATPGTVAVRNHVVVLAAEPYPLMLGA
jgi:CBS domain-containing protein